VEYAVAGGTKSGIRISLLLGALALQLCFSSPSKARGGPPYYTTDPGTSGPNSWEINLGYMPFLSSETSTSHVPDVHINYGVGERIQLTYESAWLRVRNAGGAPVYGMEQSNPGLTWRFYGSEEQCFQISIFPQGSINNPNPAVKRGLSPPGSRFPMPMEFTKKVGPVDVNWEVGYLAVLKGPAGWLGGLVVGHDVSKNWEWTRSSTRSERSIIWPINKRLTRERGTRYTRHSLSC
jgi:hypothetical protein